jgi:hypothetical protein
MSWEQSPLCVGNVSAVASSAKRLSRIGFSTRVSSIATANHRGRERELDGETGNGPSFRNALSRDGRYVVFTSVASKYAEPDVDPLLYFLARREDCLKQFVSTWGVGVCPKNMSLRSTRRFNLTPAITGGMRRSIP